MTVDTTFQGVSASPDPAGLSGGVFSYDAVESDRFGNSVSTSDYYHVHFPDAYITPQTSSIEEFTSLPPGFDTTAEISQSIELPTIAPFDYPVPDCLLPKRPHSSPSTFGPGFEIWPSVTPTPSYPGNPFLTSTYIPPSPPAPCSETRSAPTTIRAPQPRRSYPPIAPHPAGMQPSTPPKHSRSEDVVSDVPVVKRRRSSPPPVNANPTEISEEDQLLLRLRDEETLSWKDIAVRFQTDFGKTYQIPALQMRIKRLRERLRVWTQTDVNALNMAHEYWERNKFEIISAKMADFGAPEKWSPKQCARKWQELTDLAVATDIYNAQFLTPAFSYTSSPIEGPNLANAPWANIP